MTVIYNPTKTILFGVVTLSVKKGGKKRQKITLFSNYLFLTNFAFSLPGCPKCFELIQVAVNDLREKMLTFNITGGRGGASIKLRDAEFEKALNKLKRQIGDLQKRMQDNLKKDTVGTALFSEFFS